MDIKDNKGYLWIKTDKKERLDPADSYFYYKLVKNKNEKKEYIKLLAEKNKNLFSFDGKKIIVKRTLIEKDEERIIKIFFNEIADVMKTLSLENQIKEVLTYLRNLSMDEKRSLANHWTLMEKSTRRILIEKIKDVEISIIPIKIEEVYTLNDIAVYVKKDLEEKTLEDIQII